MGQREEGLRVLKGFVQNSPKSPIVPQVSSLIAELEKRETSPTTVTEIASTHAPMPAIDSLIAADMPPLSVKPWQPPGIDAIKPSVASGVTCPLDNVVAMSGNRAKELVSDVSRIAAIEHLLHQRLDKMGNAITRENRDFNYVASIQETKAGYVEIDEYRAEHLGFADFPDQIASSGFAGLALVFHPSLRDNYELSCEGLGELQGQATWLVHFRQRDDRPARIHDYKLGGEFYPVKLKGRAWITADKFQIVRIESELVSPMPKIQLASERQIVEYGPVPFSNKNTELWLPKSAEIYFDFRKHRYFRRHSFDHYMLFSVGAEEKRKEPPAPPNESPKSP
jgi:hypothetical protein